MLKKAFVIGIVALACLALPALAQQEPTTTGGVSGGVRWGALSAAFLLGIAAAAGAMAQGRATSSAAEAMSRNPGAAGPIRLMTIIGLALIESLVLYALLIASQVSRL
ncbi:MAG TPA: ATP synthase F0 subunit C [Thermoanaerobaculia bacterium]|nr:ATP synthase F0 subunit C [Thermoanaerobaculia bacterium]